MDQEKLESENSQKLNKTNEIQQSPEQHENSSFKKPTILIGKIGRLPRKVKLSGTNGESSTQKENEAIEAEKSSNKSTVNISENPEQNQTEPQVASKAPAQQLAENTIPLPYKEPNWSGLPETTGRPYKFEVLKNGAIIETIDLMKKPFYVFGRLASCDICMQHPTISRYHAVLQYRDIPSETEPPGFYIYDLGSTHGTFLNGKNNKLKQKIYVPIRVGHMLRLGCSQRSYILVGPEDDQEEESDMSVTELKQLRDQKIKEHQEKMRQAELEREAQRKKDEERGVDWGLGEDAEETEDLSENPFAQTNNEELYLDDPKKALRGFFEREGLELEYDCTEQGMGQFLCKVELPLDDEMGKPIVAEVLHRGKKKEAVVQCALEACRILDRFGVLRQATHESRKRKAKNWEENDYYDSDDDTFLDRTGVIEKKREKRMKAKDPEKAETYESLLEKEKQISASIVEIEKRLSIAQAKLDKSNSNSNSEEDSLDAYMKELKDNKPDKQSVVRIKAELAKMTKEHANIIRLVNIARPANLPPLISQLNPQPSTSKQSKPALPHIGKRLAIPVKFPQKPDSSVFAPKAVGESEEEEEEEEEEKGEHEVDMKTKKNIKDNLDEFKDSPEVSDGIKTINYNAMKKDSLNVGKSSEAGNEDLEGKASEVESSCTVQKTEELGEEDNSLEQIEESDINRSQESVDHDSDSLSDTEDDGEIRRARSDILHLRPIKSFHETNTFKKFETIMKSGLPPFADKYKQKLEKILNRLKRLASNEDRMHVDWKLLNAKKRKVMKLISDLRISEPNEKLEYKVSSELNRILGELNIMTDEKFKVIGRVKRMGYELKSISMELAKDVEALRQESNESNKDSAKCNCQAGTSKDNLEVNEDQVTKRIAETTTGIRNSENLESSDKGMKASSKRGSEGNSDTSNELDSSENINNEDSSAESDDKERKRNQKRNERRQQKAELERQRGYEEDSTREDYCMWVPPNDQSGDGRTSLNDKLGY